MPCYDLNGNAVPGTPQTCASLGGVWKDEVPQSLQQPEETVISPRPPPPPPPTPVANLGRTGRVKQVLAEQPATTTGNYSPVEEDSGIVSEIADWAMNNKVDATLLGISLIPGIGWATSGGIKLASLAKNSKWLKKAVDAMLKSKSTVTTGGKPVPKLADNGKQLFTGNLKPVFKQSPSNTSTITKFDPTKIVANIAGAGLVGKNLLEDVPGAAYSGGGNSMGNPSPVTGLHSAPTIPHTTSGAPTGTQPGTPPPPPTGTPPKSSSLWDDAKGWALKQQGNAPWDNRLFRLGELMSYSMNPSNQRPANPSTRWSEAANVAATNQANIDKSIASGSGNKANIAAARRAAKVSDKQLIDIFTVPDNWAGFGGSTDKQVGTKVARYRAATAILTVGDNVPTHYDVMKYLKDKYSPKK